MKAIVEHYAKGEFQVDRPEVAISEKFLKLNIESGTLYEGVFTVNSTNDHVIKAMVYDSRYMLRFNQHTFIAKNFDVGFTFDATCLEAGKNYKGHISVITDGGEFKILYDIDITTPYVKYGDQKIDDLFKFATLAESNWAEAAQADLQQSDGKPVGQSGFGGVPRLCTQETCADIVSIQGEDQSGVPGGAFQDFD